MAGVRRQGFSTWPTGLATRPLEAGPFRPAFRPLLLEKCVGFKAATACAEEGSKQHVDTTYDCKPPEAFAFLGSTALRASV